MNRIGGSGDFARNAFISFFMAPSVAKDGPSRTSCPWSRTWTPRSTMRRSSSPSRGWQICVGRRRGGRHGTWWLLELIGGDITARERFPTRRRDPVILHDTGTTGTMPTKPRVEPIKRQSAIE
jgi:hypothetical protein